MNQYIEKSGPRIVLAGAVNSTEVVLRKLAEFQLDVVGVFGYEAENTDHVSGYVQLSDLSAEYNYNYFSFKSINKQADRIRSLRPDYVFVVGLSQLVSQEILAIPTKCCIGFHPTWLPHGRGRAPLAWLIVDKQSEGAATFFKIADGVDDGPVVAQEKYLVSEMDDVASLIDKVLLAMEGALDVLLPLLDTNALQGQAQDESEATYYEKRTPDDGLIEWNCSADQIERLIRATTNPYPGAYSFVDDQKIIILKAEKYTGVPIVGVTGRILRIYGNDSFIVQCGDGVLKVVEYTTEEAWTPLIGAALGYKVEMELCLLKQRMRSLERLVSRVIED